MILPSEVHMRSSMRGSAGSAALIQGLDRMDAFLLERSKPGSEVRTPADIIIGDKMPSIAAGCKQNGTFAAIEDYKKSKFSEKGGQQQRSLLPNVGYSKKMASMSVYEEYRKSSGTIRTYMLPNIARMITDDTTGPRQSDVTVSLNTDRAYRTGGKVKGSLKHSKMKSHTLFSPEPESPLHNKGTLKSNDESAVAELPTRMGRKEIKRCTGCTMKSLNKTTNGNEYKLYNGNVSDSTLHGYRMPTYRDHGSVPFKKHQRTCHVKRNGHLYITISKGVGGTVQQSDTASDHSQKFEVKVVPSSPPATIDDDQNVTQESKRLCNSLRIMIKGSSNALVDQTQNSPRFANSEILKLSERKFRYSLLNLHETRSVLKTKARKTTKEEVSTEDVNAVLKTHTIHRPIVDRDYNHGGESRDNYTERENRHSGRDDGANIMVASSRGTAAS